MILLHKRNNEIYNHNNIVLMERFSRFQMHDKTSKIRSSEPITLKAKKDDCIRPIFHQHQESGNENALQENGTKISELHAKKRSFIRMVQCHRVGEGQGCFGIYQVSIGRG